MRPADGVDRRQVDHVESHGGDVGEPPLRLHEGRGLRLLRIATLGAREELVPGPDARALAIDDQRQLRRTGRGAPIGVAVHGGGDLVGVDGGDASGLRSRTSEPRDRVAQGANVVARLRLLRPRHRRLEQDASLLELDRYWHRGLDLAVQPMPPAAPRVAPGLDRVAVPSVAAQLDVPRPAVVVDRAHRRLLPGLLVVGTQQEGGIEQVMAVGEDVRGDDQLIAHDPLHRMAAIVQLRLDALDDHAAARADRLRPGLGRRGVPRGRRRGAGSPSSSSWLWRNPTRSAHNGPDAAAPPQGPHGGHERAPGCMWRARSDRLVRQRRRIAPLPPARRPRRPRQALPARPRRTRRLPAPGRSRSPTSHHRSRSSRSHRACQHRSASPPVRRAGSLSRSRPGGSSQSISSPVTRR